MHYYQFNLSDYITSTAHLTPTEDIIYRRLIDLYYEKESPIPEETQWVSRKIRMGNEIELVGLILQEFFELQDDKCWHHGRCDTEIARYQARATTAKANGSKGGRPKKPKKTQSVNLANPEITKSKANQQPITNNQEDLVEQEIQEKILSELNLQAGKNFRPLDANLKFIKARLKQGYSPDDLIAVITLKTREWKNDPKHFKYLRPATLFNDTKFNQYIGDVGAIVPMENQNENRQTSSCERATKAREDYDKEQFERNQLDLEGMGEV